MTTPTAATTTQTTLWIWPTGLFPRRLVYYLRAKRLPHSILATHNMTLIPATINPKIGLVSTGSHEERPAGTSLPFLRLQKPGEEPFYIYESMAIMEYFEDLFASEGGYPDLRGNTLEQRARTRDVLSLLADATFWQGLSLMHGDASTLSWSGMTADQMSATAAQDARARHYRLLSKLEKWVGDGIVKKGWRSISGEGVEVSLADLVLMTAIQYAEESYGQDWIEEHGALRVWCERAKGEAWFVEREELERCEKEGFEGLFVG
ncbi:hypothetical protein K505DRAFT_324905 [Melanomma pulvis-pyrius CBS 109.77]|uniref:GST C-terminal domain-containing protein n=1 Tax=Melanomma pulvis-pyrius CBS 109.77 TaxID=1314802 RepID=A0A6A6XDB9_9PLEO|nr:hypothetical protein K505DRAFT_324905 [Melanomma pulvis-pyrius CBS 109.77]